MGFPGRQYRQSIVVADATAVSDLAPGTAHAFAKDDGMLFMFPLPSGSWRLIASSYSAWIDDAGSAAVTTSG